MRIGNSLFIAALTLVLVAALAAQRAIRPGAFTGEPVTVAQPTPFPLGCNAPQTGTVYENGPVEPYAAVDPGNPNHLVGAWQQDRWSTGGANGVRSAYSLDGGATWMESGAKFSTCAGGPYQRASDPWVSIAPDGTVHQVILGLNGTGQQTAVVVSRSLDAGLTWTDPLTVHFDSAGADDKESITADPTDSRYVYIVWDRSGPNNRIVTWFARSVDGGATWSQPAIIHDSGASSFETAHQIVVQPGGLLVDIFVLSFNASSGHTAGVWVAAMRSSDHGATWSAPTLVAQNLTIGTVNPKTQAPLRTGAGIPSAAVDASTGAIYVAWSDGRFSQGARDGIALTQSKDGLNWSEPVQANQAPNVQAFTPAVAAANGKVAVSYFDFREDSDDPTVLLANAWRAVAVNGAWSEVALTGPFDMLQAPAANGLQFLGDYQGLVATRTGFLSFITAAGDAATPSRVLAVSQGRRPLTSKTQRTEVNLHPKAYNPKDKPEPKK